MQKTYLLKLTAAVALAGVIHRAGAEVSVDEATAKNLLHRGKAVLADESEEVTLRVPAEVAAAVDANPEGAAKALEAEAKPAPAPKAAKAPKSGK